MNLSLIDELVRRAARLGAKGYEVLGWNPPSSATEDPDGTLIIRKAEFTSASQTPWYER